jgi:hypothetical protein
LLICEENNLYLFLKKHLKLLLIFVCSSVSFFACQTDPCFFPKEPRLLLQIYRTADTLITSTDIEQIFAENITDTVTPLFIKGGLLLPLRQNIDSTSFKIKLKNYPDTFRLSVNYSRKVGLSAPECGFVTFYEQVKATKHTFDTLITDRSFIDTTYAVNMRTYLQY